MSLYNRIITEAGFQRIRLLLNQSMIPFKGSFELVMKSWKHNETDINFTKLRGGVCLISDNKDLNKPRIPVL